MSHPREALSSDERIVVLETTLNHVYDALSDIKGDQRCTMELIHSVNESMSIRTEAKLDNVTDRIWNITLWLISFMVAGFTSTWLTMAHGFKWI